MSRVTSLEGLFGALAVLALIVGVASVHAIRLKRRSVSAPVRTSLVLLGLVVAGLVGTGFVIQRRELRESQAQIEEARREARKRQIRAAGLALATAQKLQQPLLYRETLTQLLDENDKLISRAFSPSEGIEATPVLWIESPTAPSSGILERVALETLGVTVDTASTNADALRRVESTIYRAIITDQLRLHESDTAAYELLTAVRARDLAVPILIYDDVRVDSASGIARGAAGVTADPHRLFELIVSSVGSKERL